MMSKSTSRKEDLKASMASRPLPPRTELTKALTKASEEMSFTR